MSNSFNLEAGNRIRKRREYLGYTREQLAELADISPYFLSCIECGSKGMSVTTLMKMCDALKLTADYILFGIKEKTGNSELMEIFKNIDPQYIPYAEELLKVFVKSTNEK